MTFTLFGSKSVSLDLLISLLFCSLFLSVKISLGSGSFSQSISFTLPDLSRPFRIFFKYFSVLSFSWSFRHDEKARLYQGMENYNRLVWNFQRFFTSISSSRTNSDTINRWKWAQTVRFEYICNVLLELDLEPKISSIKQNWS